MGSRVSHALRALSLLVACEAAGTTDGSVSVYVGSGCFFARQHLMVDEFEQSVLRRADSDITSIAGYAGSSRQGSNGTVCYHNAQNASDYGFLGHAEVVKLDVPIGSLVAAFSTYFKSFVQLPEGIWDREDYYDVGAEYRSLVGFPGGLHNSQLVAALQKGNVHNMTLRPGRGADPDTFGTNSVFVMDSDEFPFTQGERCLQFHDDSIAKYPASYHRLREISEAHGRLAQTACPPNYICSTPTATLSLGFV